jgi:hypothetical protein
MPWTKNQQIIARIAEHAPEKLYAKNRSVLSMTRAQLHEMATGPRKKKKKSAINGG